MPKLSSYSLWRRLAKQNESFHRRLRLTGYVVGAALCYLIPDEWFQAAGMWFRAALTVVMNRIGLR